MRSGELLTPLQAVREGCERQPDLTILTFVDIGQDGGLADETRSYRDLLRHGRAVAAGLRREVMAEGDRFALIMRNHPEFVEAMVGSEIAGTVFVPIDPRTRGEKLAYMLDFARCRGAIVTADLLPAVLAIQPSLPQLEWIWIVGEGAEPQAGLTIRRMDDVLADAGDVALPAPDLANPMQILYTSGTTGDPKAILSSYGRFAAIAALGATIGLRDGDRLYTGLSLTHANAQLISLGNALVHGLPLVVSRWFTKSRLWDILKRYDCTTFNLLGGMAIAIFAEPASPADRDHRLRFVLSAGMPAKLWPAFASRFGVDIHEFFGAAEGGLTLNPPDGPIGSIGMPLPGTRCAILDQKDRRCAPGELGEICFSPERGEPSPVIYLGDPAASAAKIRDGWFRSGDAGWMDADGWFYFAHRLTGAIRRNGDFISAAQIEAAIAGIDGVADVCVYGLATAASAPGEKEVAAAIVRATGARPDPSVIFDHCRRTVGSNAVPTLLQFVDEIPKTASEKPQERFLADRLSHPDAELIGIDGRPARAPILR